MLYIFISAKTEKLKGFLPVFKLCINMKKKIIPIIISAIVLAILLSLPKKEKLPTNTNRSLYVQTFRYGKQPITIEECIKDGIVVENMTLEECNKAVKGEYKLITKLEDDWTIRSHKSSNIFFKNDIVKSRNDIQIERMKKVFEIIKKSHSEK